MRRLIVLGTIVIAAALSVAVTASQAPAVGGQGGQKPCTVEIEKLKDNLFMLRGGGGNTAVFVMSKGVAVVDTKNPGCGAPILARIKEVTDKPVTLIVNTHTHGDHVSGNVEFPPTVDVVTHQNTAANMKQMRSSNPNAVNVFKENNGRNLAKRTFTDRMAIGSGADQIDLRYYGRGHTDGDAWIIFPSLRMMHAGDIFSGKNLPLLDGLNGGTGIEIPDTLAKAAAASTNVDGIITGHSTVMTVADLKEYSEFNRDFREYVRAGKKAGQSVDELVKGWTMPAKYQGYTAPQEARVRANVQIIFDAIK